VECAGSQYLLDDDNLERVLVHNDLTAYKDARTSLAASLTALTQSWNVQTDNGVITLFADTAYESGNASVLEREDDHHRRAHPRNLVTALHPDWSGIGDPTFAFPNFAPDGPR
jgi:hypothetical protein